MSSTVLSGNVFLARRRVVATPTLAGPMGLFAQNPKKEERPGDASGLHLDLDERVCPRCRRTLHPWEPECPEDGTPGVERSSVPRVDLPAPPAHLLDDDGDEG